MQAFKRAIAASLLLTLATPLFAQFNPYAPYVPANNDPRSRRALRERAVAYAGPASREFVETQGDPAVAAIFACSEAGARKLVEFHNSGGLARLPRPADMLSAIAVPGNGDDVALYAIQHADELTDVDTFDAFLLSPLEYACSLRKLSDGAAEVHARRQSAQAAAAPWQATLDGRAIAVIVGVVGVVLLIRWRMRRHAA